MSPLTNARSTALLNKRNSGFARVPPEVTMERYIHEQNLAHYRRLIAESTLNPDRNEIQHKWLLKLLADEIAKGSPDLRH